MYIMKFVFILFFLIFIAHPLVGGILFALLYLLNNQSKKQSQSLEIEVKSPETSANTEDMTSVSYDHNLLYSDRLNTTRAQRHEYLVSDMLHTLDQDTYTILDNVTLPSTGNTSFTQIDHIVVSQYGVFCVETKSHVGWIFGSVNDSHWTRTRYKERTKFYNPLRQNFVHTQSLKDLLGSHVKAGIVPLVVFTCADKINVSGVCNVGDIEFMLRKIRSYQSPVYTPQECQRIINCINFFNHNDYQTAEKHRAEVSSLVASLSV